MAGPDLTFRPGGGHDPLRAVAAVLILCVLTVPVHACKDELAVTNALATDDGLRSMPPQDPVPVCPLPACDPPPPWQPCPVLNGSQPFTRHAEHGKRSGSERGSRLLRDRSGRRTASTTSSAAPTRVAPSRSSVEVHRWRPDLDESGKHLQLQRDLAHGSPVPGSPLHGTVGPNDDDLHGTADGRVEGGRASHVHQLWSRLGRQLAADRATHGQSLSLHAVSHSAPASIGGGYLLSYALGLRGLGHGRSHDSTSSSRRTGSRIGSRAPFPEYRPVVQQVG